MRGRRALDKESVLVHFVTGSFIRTFYPPLPESLALREWNLNPQRNGGRNRMTEMVRVVCVGVVVLYDYHNIII